LPETVKHTSPARYFGPYRVINSIAVGRMVSAYLARTDGPHESTVIMIKCIDAHVIEDEKFIQAILNEARAVARISDPNVARVFDVGKDEGTYWIAMEHLQGEPLRELMRRTDEAGQPMPPEIACRVIADAAEGLHTAHELRLVHGHVTPDHLFVTHAGSTKVVDFGIAKVTSRLPEMPRGRLEGLLAYMSPEQVHGEQIERRTDVFGLGVVLWELTTGHRLFQMDGPLATLKKVEECEVPRPSAIVKDYPLALEEIAMRALSKQPGERFATARAFSRAIQSLIMRRGLFIASDEVATWLSNLRMAP
jgi:serine/threonine-protein kinase